MTTETPIFMLAVKTGFKRFRSEGYYVWSKKDLQGLLGDLDINSPMSIRPLSSGNW